MSSAVSPAPHSRRRLLVLARRAGILLLVLLLVGVLAFVVWAKTGVMGPEEEPLAAVLEDPAITVEDSSAAWTMRPSGVGDGVGLVFFPGAKVDPRSYAERLSALVREDGMTVVIAKPWLNLALLDRRGLDTFTAGHDEVDAWIVGGHSLGGVRACQLAADADALVLFASYCSSDIPGGTPAASLAGTEDRLATADTIAEQKSNLPADALMVTIPGANHASFGDYGAQSGDGTASITDAQMDAIVRDCVGTLVDRIR